MNHKIFNLLLILFVFITTVWADEGKWEFNPYDFQYDMTVYTGINVDGSGVEDLARYSVAAFCGEECRGIMEVKNAGDVQYGYLRIRSNKESGEQVTFKVYDRIANVIIKCDDTIAFQTQGLQGLPSSPMILHAANKYKVDYVVDGDVVQSEYVYYGEPLVLIDAPEKTGYTFAKWLDVPETMPSHDVTVTGSYTVNTYILTFKTGDDVISEMTVAYGSEIVEPTVPEKEGHTFAGWEEYPSTMPASDLTVNGSYIVNIYTVTYMVEDEIVRVDYVEYGATLPEVPEVPEKEGYDFLGWSDIPITMPAKNIIITGKFEVTTGVGIVVSDSETVDVFDLQGHLVKKNVVLNRITEYLPKGVYIINRRKFIVEYD